MASAPPAAPGGPPRTWLGFGVDFSFRSPLYARAAQLFLDEVVLRMVGAFDARCRFVEARAQAATAATAAPGAARGGAPVCEEVAAVARAKPDRDGEERLRLHMPPPPLPVRASLW
jgi:hypothetical protein